MSESTHHHRLSDTQTCIALPLHHTLSLRGEFELRVLKGYVEMDGARLRAGAATHWCCRPAYGPPATIKAFATAGQPHKQVGKARGDFQNQLIG